MITIVDFGSKKTPAIASAVSACGVENKILHWENAKREDFENASAIIFSGSPVFFTEADNIPYTSKFDFIREGKIPVLGICFGHQLMGLIHGAKIFRGKEVREEIEIRVVKEDPLFKSLAPLTAMTEDHTEGISLPPGFLHLATSASYTIEAMRHPLLPLWGVQFHPEVSGKNGETLIRNFLVAAKA
jgi:GMP synthase (glutamine-hydrolysing)